MNTSDSQEDEVMRKPASENVEPESWATGEEAAAPEEANQAPATGGQEAAAQDADAPAAANTANIADAAADGADAAPEGESASASGTIGLGGAVFGAAAESTSKPNPKWGKAVAGGDTGFAAAVGNREAQNSGQGMFPPGPGAWAWLPHGLEVRKPWRKRHPVIFWSAIGFVLAMVFLWGRMSGGEDTIMGPKLAVITVDGMILDGTEVVAWIEKVRLDPDYKGAVLRINSPGGAVGPSQEIFAAVKRLAKDKPVVASMGALAASGGYYIALGAEEIYASPSTLTASIGVKMQIPNIEELMRTVGISEKTLTTGSLKDAGTSWRDMLPEEEAYFRALIGDMFDEFIETVARERDMPLEKVRQIADGRAMTGRQALEAELIDALGDLHDAGQSLRERCGISDEKSVKWVNGPEKKVPFLQELVDSAMNALWRQSVSASQPVFIY